MRITMCVDYVGSGGCKLYVDEQTYNSALSTASAANAEGKSNMWLEGKDVWGNGFRVPGSPDRLMAIYAEIERPFDRPM